MHRPLLRDSLHSLGALVLAGGEISAALGLFPIFWAPGQIGPTLGLVTATQMLAAGGVGMLLGLALLIAAAPRVAPLRPR